MRRAFGWIADYFTGYRTQRDLNELAHKVESTDMYELYKESARDDIREAQIRFGFLCAIPFVGDAALWMIQHGDQPMDGAAIAFALGLTEGARYGITKHLGRRFVIGACNDIASAMESDAVYRANLDRDAELARRSGLIKLM